MQSALEAVAAFYVLVIVYCALYVAGQRFAAWLEERQRRGLGDA